MYYVGTLQVLKRVLKKYLPRMDDGCVLAAAAVR